MKFTQLFSDHDGKKITEKYLYRMLVVSICGIFLCMGCLAGTTWAWFAVTIENKDNVIQIGEPAVFVTLEDAEFLSGDVLPGGENTICVTHANEADSLERKSTLYVAFSLDELVQGYVTLGGENEDTTDLTVIADQEHTLSWVVSWFVPEGAELLEENLIDFRSEEVQNDDIDEETKQDDLVEGEDESTGEGEGDGTGEGEGDGTGEGEGDGTGEGEGDGTGEGEGDGTGEGDVNGTGEAEGISDADEEGILDNESGEEGNGYTD